MKNMTLSLIDHDSIVLDEWNMIDDLSRDLFSDFAALEGVPAVTASRIRTRLKTFEDQP